MKEEKNTASTKKVTRGIYSKLSALKSEDIFLCCLYCVCAYMFGQAEMLLQTYPLGIAFMCAVGKHIPSAAAGVAVAALACGDPAVYLCGVFTAFIFRYSLYCVTTADKQIVKASLKDSVLSRACSACAGLLSVSLIRIISGGFTYYDLFAGMFSLLIGGFMVYLYSLISDEKNRYTPKYEAGVAAIFFSSVLALRYAEILGMSCGAIAAFVLPLYSGRKGGALRGAVIGFLCGAVLDASLCPMFGIAGFVCGVLSPVASVWSVAAGVIAACVGAMYIGGVESLIAYLPEAFVSCAAYIPLDKMNLLPRLRVFRDDVMYKNAVSVREISNIRANINTKAEFSDLACTLASVSEVMCALADRERRPAVHEIAEVCEKEFESFCKKCSMKKLCFPKGIRNAESIRKTACSIHEKGVLASNDMPEKIKTNCYFADKLTVSINISLSSYNSEKMRNNKTEVMAEDYQRISELISDAVARTEDDNAINKELTEKLQSRMSHKELFAGNAAVYGTRLLTVIACGLDMCKIKALSSEVQRNFGKILSVRFDEPEFTVCGDYLAMVLTQKERFSCESAYVQRAKNGEVINGDSIFTLNACNRFFACLCDGMGSGRQAALTSKLSCVFLQKLLSCGCNITPVLKMLNHFIRRKTGECFTTVDLLQVDLLSGKADFIKSGASASFVLREGRIFRLASHTPPVGIMAELCAEKIEFAFQNDDIVVMISDGVCDSEDQPVDIYNVLTYESDCSLETLCERVMNAVKNNHNTDDMTVCAVKISAQ